MAFLATGTSWRIIFDLVMIGAFGGFYIVPLYALVQVRSDPAHVSRVIASNNILNALFMVVAALFGAFLLQAGGTIPQLFLASAILNAAVALYIYLLVPEFLMRFVAWMLIHTIYRLRTTGLENIPQTGAALIACNHVSFVDAIVILAASPRPIRFVMDHHIFRVPILSFVFRTGKAIPIAPFKEDPAMLEAAYAEVSRALAHGELVAIFPEGRITANGEIGDVQARHQADPRRQSSAADSDGIARAVGQHVQPQGRTGVFQGAAQTAGSDRAERGRTDAGLCGYT